MEHAVLGNTASHAHGRRARDRRRPLRLLWTDRPLVYSGGRCAGFAADTYQPAPWQAGHWWPARTVPREPRSTIAVGRSTWPLPWQVRHGTRLIIRGYRFRLLDHRDSEPVAPVE
ncbi:hypothetical protein GCM10022220_28200 [Actinocatenispora rupis]